MPHEYLLLENRQKIGSDKFLANSGLLIWHVDEIITDMYPANNSVNVDPNYYGVNLIQADGQGDLYDYDGMGDFSRFPPESTSPYRKEIQRRLKKEKREKTVR